MTTRTILAALALAAAPGLAQAPATPKPAAAPLPALKPGQQAALHCSAVFARTAHERAAGGAAAGLPDTGARGREYFVRFAAGLMDDIGASRDQVARLLARALGDVDRSLAAAPDRVATLRTALVPCRALLDLEVPPDSLATTPAL